MQTRERRYGRRESDPEPRTSTRRGSKDGDARRSSALSWEVKRPRGPQAFLPPVHL